jgi:hypothetical protein
MVVDEAHRAASSAAMELLRRQQDLAGGLSVLKRYFLTAQVRRVERGGPGVGCDVWARGGVVAGGSFTPAWLAGECEWE